jgi:competence protein ComEC
VLCFFVLLSGFSAPAVRAAFMFTLMLIGKTLFKQVESANIVLVAAFFSLCINPYWLVDVGFQLSYIAVLGIIYLYPFFYNMFSFPYTWADKLWALSSVSLAAQLATLPITLYYFHQFPLLFLVTNLVVIPISIAVMYGGILLLIFSKIKIIAGSLVWLTALLIKIMNASALYFDGLPFCVVDGINLSYINMVLLYVLLLLLFISIEEKSFRLLMSSFILGIIIVCISLFFDLQTKKNHELVIYNSDKSNVLSVFSGNKAVMFLDTIPDERLQKTIDENRVRNNVISVQLKKLPEVSLLHIGTARILFVKEADLVSENLLLLEKADYIWIPAFSLKNKRIPTILIPYKNVIISGKISNRKNINNFYLTAKKGAFVLPLQ